MDNTVEDLSARLRDQLAESEREAMPDDLRAELEHGDRRTFVADTRQVPARFHHLSAMGQSAAHARVALQYSNDRDSLAMRLGAGVHALVFDAKPVIAYAGQRRKASATAKNPKPSKWDEFAALHADKIILTTKGLAHAQHISAALLAHEHAAPLLFAEGARREHTLLWEQLGRARRSTPDVHTPEIVVELKTTRCAEPGKFARDALWRGYHAQVADQCNAVEAVYGKRPEHAFIVAVETVSPYAITVFELTPALLEKGDRLCQAWLERLQLCEATGRWPAYSCAIETMDVPDGELLLDLGRSDREVGDGDADDLAVADDGDAPA